MMLTIQTCVHVCACVRVYVYVSVCECECVGSLVPISLRLLFLGFQSPHSHIPLKDRWKPFIKMIPLFSVNWTATSLCNKLPFPEALPREVFLDTAFYIRTRFTVQSAALQSAVTPLGKRPKCPGAPHASRDLCTRGRRPRRVSRAL